MLVSAVQQSESHTHTYIPPFWISFPFRSPERTEYSSSWRFSIVIYFIRACTRAKSLQLCLILCDRMDCSLPRSSVNGDSPGKNTGMGCHALLQGIFQTQGSNLGLLYCRWILYCLRYQGSYHWLLLAESENSYNMRCKKVYKLKSYTGW